MPRTHRVWAPSFRAAVKARKRPSGDSATGPGRAALMKNCVSFGGSTDARTTLGLGRGTRAECAANPRIAAPAIEAAATQGASPLRCRTVCGAPVIPGSPPARSASRLMRASPMSRSRWRGFRSKQRSSRRRSPGGTSAGTASRSISLLSTPASVSATVSLAKSRAPVSISCRTTPNAQMSARRSTFWPLACSGDMYAAVPRITPACVACADIVGDWDASDEPDSSSAIALARPKSSTLT